MLFLTDDGPINCDNASHEVRDMRTGRRPRYSPAQDDALIRAMVRDWAKSKRHAHDSRSTPRQDINMPSSFNPDVLFQKDPDSRDSGPAFAQAWDSRHERRMSPRDGIKNLLMWARTRLATRRHAFDSADRDEALKQIDRIKNHVAVRGGTPEYDAKYVAACLKALMGALADEDAEDDSGDIVDMEQVDPNAPEDIKAEYRRVLGAGGRKGNDEVGETPARSVVSPRGRAKVDHRNDFRDTVSGGAEDPSGDSALAFDADRLMQRSGR
jgi:hypothetical protein